MKKIVVFVIVICLCLAGTGCSKKISDVIRSDGTEQGIDKDSADLLEAALGAVMSGDEEDFAISWKHIAEALYGEITSDDGSKMLTIAVAEVEDYNNFFQTLASNLAVVMHQSEGDPLYRETVVITLPDGSLTITRGDSSKKSTIGIIASELDCEDPIVRKAYSEMMVLYASDSYTDEEMEDPSISYEVTYSNVTNQKDIGGDVWTYLVFEIENTGEVPIFFDKASCDLVNTGGQVVDTVTSLNACPPIINPGEKTYFYCANKPDDLTDMGELTISPNLAVFVSPTTAVRLGSSNVELDFVQKGYVAVEGIIKNTTSEKVDADYSVVLFNAADNPVATLHYFIGNMEPGEEKPFDAIEMVADDVTADIVTRCEVFAYPNN